jgi:hypothetical protein
MPGHHARRDACVSPPIHGRAVAFVRARYPPRWVPRQTYWLPACHPPRVRRRLMWSAGACSRCLPSGLARTCCNYAHARASSCSSCVRESAASVVSASPIRHSERSVPCLCFCAKRRDAQSKNLSWNYQREGLAKPLLRYSAPLMWSAGACSRCLPSGLARTCCNYAHARALAEERHPHIRDSSSSGNHFKPLMKCSCTAVSLVNSG